MTVSAGLLLYRRGPPGLEVLIAHPGGPLWARKDDGAWSIVKGEADAGETTPDELLGVARREFREETGLLPPDGPTLQLGAVRLRSGKAVHAWAIEGDLDPAAIVPGTFELEWPPRSRRRMTVPEIDRVAWCAPDEARRRLNPAQAPFVDRLVTLLEG